MASEFGSCPLYPDDRIECRNYHQQVCAVSAERDHRFAEAVRTQIKLYSEGKCSLGTIGVAAIQAEAEVYEVESVERH